ncbi:ABC transporter ATP-binding protein/permease [Marinimicrobium sp. C6131]|uniref:ABC transporter ATP-binding protein n=1 Tax=Marinimicrobium sp. C6131 TaxID=3022676 RepID=UPI00223DCECD|nr:ABC transporter ATP-binding protein [Marinimicrobium sp. C6131]UZJ43912.1 ABC transporter ATP-binding protein/permease [Marinimicrobium sp. C6131]
MYILSVIKNIFKILDSGTRKKYIVLQIFFLFSAVFQVIGIASIGPFISILSNPEIIHSNAVLSSIYRIGGFNSDNQFIVAAAVGSLVMIIVSNAVGAISMWFTYRFSVILGSRIQQTVYRSFLRKSYLFHKTKNYNKLIAVVSHQIPRFVYMVFQPFLLLTSSLFIVGIIISGLIILDPVLAVLSGALIGGSYLITYVVLRTKLAYHGKVLSDRNDQVQSILSESFIGIKDIKLGSMEQNYINQFDAVNTKGLRSQAFISLSGEVPKFIIESISFGAILVLALVLIGTKDNIEAVIPMLSIYALAGYKLLPTMQQIYKSISSLSGHGEVAGIIKSHIESKHCFEEATGKPETIRIEHVSINEISFSYPESSVPAVNKVSLDLNRGNIYSLAGHSGSGKSTLADLMLGLLELESGQILVNGLPLNKNNLISYRNSLSYVAQNIFILDDTVISNVAFGIPEDDVDLNRVREALNLSGAYEFVEQLPEGLYTELGQDGKLLSGGQRQRIGIARALYRQSDLLVLDEPTSALDMESEYNLLKTLNEIKKDTIILIISHRPASIRLSDYVVLMSEGKVEAFGSYQNLISDNKSFKKLMESETDTVSS